MIRHAPWNVINQKNDKSNNCICQDGLRTADHKTHVILGNDKIYCFCRMHINASVVGLILIWAIVRNYFQYTPIALYTHCATYGISQFMLLEAGVIYQTAGLQAVLCACSYQGMYWNLQSLFLFCDFEMNLSWPERFARDWTKVISAEIWPSFKHISKWYKDNFPFLFSDFLSLYYRTESYTNIPSEKFASRSSMVLFQNPTNELVKGNWGLYAAVN